MAGGRGGEVQRLKWFFLFNDPFKFLDEVVFDIHCVKGIFCCFLFVCFWQKEKSAKLKNQMYFLKELFKIPLITNFEMQDIKLFS